MAKNHSATDPNLIEAYGGPSGRKLVRAVRRSGTVIANGRTHGRVKTGLTVAEVVALYRASDRYSNVRVTFAGERLEGPIVTAEAAEARLERQRKTAARRAAALEAEAVTLEAEGPEAVARAALEHKRSPENGEARYVYSMARFHGGQSGGDLHLAMSASFALPRGTTPERRAELDDMADRLAREVFGSDLRGAMPWARVLGVRQGKNQ